MPVTGNVFSTSNPINVGSTASKQYVFGFTANYLRIYNASIVDLYLDMLGNTPSTGGTAHVIKTLDKMEGRLPLGFQQIALTTTSTGAAGAQVYVLALSD